MDLSSLNTTDTNLQNTKVEIVSLMKIKALWEFSKRFFNLNFECISVSFYSN